jgi:hypothetical protein
MKEAIYNIFVHFENDVCSVLSYTIHDYQDTDEESIAFLQKKIPTDLLTAHVFKLSKSFTREKYNATSRLGNALSLFEELFIKLEAVSTPLSVITPLRNGEIWINYVTDFQKLNMSDVDKKLGINSIMDDWLIKYYDEEKKGIHASKLINDDYFLAIKLTANAGLYVSSLKLLLSCIDSLAYIEYGDYYQTPFIGWLKTYADLTILGITAEELWEFRNGILHMTNLESRKVAQNKVRRISVKIGGNLKIIENSKII